MHAYGREYECVTHQHRKLRPLREVFWCSFGGEKWEAAATCAERAVHADPTKYLQYQEEKSFLLLAAFPLEGWKSKACAVCNDLHVETSFIPCAPELCKQTIF